MARKRRRKASAAPKRRRRRSVRRNPGMLSNPRRRRRATTRRRTSRRRRTVRRNPSLGGAVRLVTRGVRDAGVMVAGEMASNIIAGYIPAILKDQSGAESNTGVALRKVISAAVVGFAAQTFVRNADIARMAVAGALASPLKGFIRPMLPDSGIISKASLSAYPMRAGVLSAYPQMPVLAAPRLSGYPRRGIGCDDGYDSTEMMTGAGAY